MSVRDLTDDEILEHLKNNTILRNKQLSVLVRLLNSLDSNSTLAIDGAWGSGKTVFIKQLQILADSSIENYGNSMLNKPEIEKLRETQKVFYFNAWENDYLGDALGAIILKLIMTHDEGFNEGVVKRAFSMLEPGAAIKTLSADLINPDANRKKEELVKDIKQIVDRHQAVDEFIDKIKRHNERVIFIIDELDRCRPSFAVDLLEVTKHYFTRSDATFIFTTNTTELSHTVKKYYGNDFDGVGYLNKFFDFTYHLKNIDPQRYTRTVINWTFDGDMLSGTALNSIDYFRFHMREINSYISALKIVEGFTDSLRGMSSDPRDDSFVKYLLLPFALALKIKNMSDFLELINGTEKGAEILRAFAAYSSEMQDFIKEIDLRSVDTSTSESELAEIQMNEFIKQYRNLFTRESRSNRTAIYLQSFQEAVSLLGSYTTIHISEAEQ